MRYISFAIVFFLGLFGGYLLFSSNTHQVNLPASLLSDSSTRTDTDHINTTNNVNLNEDQVKQIVAQLSQQMQNPADNPSANTPSLTQKNSNDVEAKKRIESTTNNLIAQIDAGQFFVSNVTIGDLENSSEMQSLPAAQQGMVMSRVFGMLNTGKLTREQVFGPQPKNKNYR